MALGLSQLLAWLDRLLEPSALSDYCPNGLQVEGRPTIRRIVTGVTASQALIDAAVAQQADALLVHHGYFWKGEPAVLTGMKKRRLATLLKHDINLLAYHLPLDVHPEVGNNAQLGRLLGIRQIMPLAGVSPTGLVMQGELDKTLAPMQLKTRLEHLLARPVLCEQVSDRPVQRLAWCSGGGQHFIEQAAMAGADAFVTGEVSEQTIHIAREMNIHFFAAGHHATERYGIRALGDKLSAELKLDVTFIDIDNPA